MYTEVMSLFIYIGEKSECEMNEREWMIRKKKKREQGCVQERICTKKKKKKKKQNICYFAFDCFDRAGSKE